MIFARRSRMRARVFGRAGTRVRSTGRRPDDARFGPSRLQGIEQPAEGSLEPAGGMEILGVVGADMEDDVAVGFSRQIGHHMVADFRRDRRIGAGGAPGDRAAAEDMQPLGEPRRQAVGDVRNADAGRRAVTQDEEPKRRFLLRAFGIRSGPSDKTGYRTGGRRHPLDAAACGNALPGIDGKGEPSEERGSEHHRGSALTPSAPRRPAAACPPSIPGRRRPPSRHR